MNKAKTFKDFFFSLSFEKLFVLQKKKKTLKLRKDKLKR